jgi:predicted ATPase with chaperone activity
MLARRLTTLVPAMTLAEALETTRSTASPASPATAPRA